MSSSPYESPETPGTPPPPSTTRPTSLFRILLIVGIGAVVFALFILPNRRGAREAARRMQCVNNLKLIGLALHNYHDEYKSLPPAYVADADGKPMHSWRVLILPYLEQQALYNKYNLNEPWNGPNNSKLHNEVVRVFCCPSRLGRQTETDTSYVVVRGSGTAWPADKTISFKDITDGTSNTIMVVEMHDSAIHWMEPRDLDFDQIPMAINPSEGHGISSPHPNVAQAVFFDGHTAVLKKGTPAEIIRRLLTIADGEQIGDY